MLRTDDCCLMYCVTFRLFSSFPSFSGSHRSVVHANTVGRWALVKDWGQTASGPELKETMATVLLVTPPPPLQAAVPVTVASPLSPFCHSACW